MKKIEKNFIDEKGKENRMIIEPVNVYKLNMGEESYRIIKKMKPSKMKNFSVNPFVSDIGVRSGGFTKIFLLSFLVAIAAVVILYLLFKY